jgi:spore coat polysaccharide biosynthesis protein SpsF
VILGKVASSSRRAGSTRLPAKVLASLTGASVLAHCASRLKASGVGPVIVATTTLPADDAVVGEAKRLGGTPFRGDSDDRS